MQPREDDYDNERSNNNGNRQEEEEEEGVELLQQQQQQQPCEPFVVSGGGIGIGQPLQPIDVEEQVTLPTDIDDDDDEITIRWKTSPYAVGKVKLRWSDEFVLESADNEGAAAATTAKYCSPHSIISGMASLCCDSWTERVGNMSVIYKRSANKRDGGDNNPPPEIVIVAGPFWFVTLFITIPLIVGISLVIYFKYIRCYNNLGYEIGWGILLGILLGCLVTASLSNPGILLRHSEPPSSNNDNNDSTTAAAANNNATNEEWIWNDQALTYRPPKAKYDPICAVVVEGFDHVCPWVGTAIGAGNMRWFRRFILMIGICLCYDIILLYLAECFP